MTFLEIDGKAVKLREKLRVKHRRRIEAATYAFLSSPLGQTVAASGVDIEDVPEAERSRLVSEHANDMALKDAITDAVILGYVESVEGAEPTEEWLQNLEEDDYAMLEERTDALEAARRDAAPTTNPDGVEQPDSPTTA